MSDSSNQPAPPKATGAVPRCESCGYSFVGLDYQGCCPECGCAYTADSRWRLKPWPSTGAILFRFAWPLALYVLPFGVVLIAVGASIAGNLAGAEEAGFVTAVTASCGFPVYALVAIINSIVVARRLGRNHVPLMGRGAPHPLGSTRGRFMLSASLLGMAGALFIGGLLSIGACAIALG